jgi:hexosaminidase
MMPPACPAGKPRGRPPSVGAGRVIRPLLAVVPLVSALMATTLPAQAPAARPHDATAFHVIPRPNELVPGTGNFTLSAATVLHADTEFDAVARRFARDVAPATGFDLAVSAAAPATGTPVIRLQRDASVSGDEAYRLDVTPSGVTVRAAGPAGAFYALETFKQLLPAAIYREAPVERVQWTAPAVRISDAPRFGWRGSHMDVSRHFMPKAHVLKHLDLMARHKLNRFHWHLTEDQGWRIEIRKYPRLTEVGGCRARTIIGRHVQDPARRPYDNVPHCGFYTQDDIREIVAYAAERHIVVVPEIEMPGHAQAAIAAYPQLGVFPDSQVGVYDAWGISPVIFNADESTIRFLQDVLTEVLALFPGPWIHIGGDEAIKDQWKASSRIQARIKELGVKDEHELQSWFIKRMDTFLTERGRRLIGWDEILEGGLAPNATVMSWRGTAGGIAAAKAGHDVVMAPNSHTYFDHYQSRDQAREPLAIGGFSPLDHVYAYEPIPSELSAEEAKRVLGAQAQLWSEYIPTPRHMEYMAWPRLSALSEVVWSAKDQRDLADFMRRLHRHGDRLNALGVNYRRW